MRVNNVVARILQAPDATVWHSVQNDGSAQFGHTPKLTAHQLAGRSASRFFVGIAGVGRRDDRLRDDYTLPLFSLTLILEADGTLAHDAADALGMRQPNSDVR